MSESWSKWVPVEGLTQRYDVHSINFRQGWLRIVLTCEREEPSRVIITFVNAVLGYRHANESLRAGTACFLAELYGRDFFTKWTFFKVENSSFMQSVLRSECEAAPCTHYSLLTAETVLDVLAAAEPMIELVGDARKES